MTVTRKDIIALIEKHADIGDYGSGSLDAEGLADAIFDALPATPAASGDGDAAWRYQGEDRHAVGCCLHGPIRAESGGLDVERMRRIFHAEYEAEDGTRGCKHTVDLWDCRDRVAEVVKMDARLAEDDHSDNPDDEYPFVAGVNVVDKTP